MADLQKTIKGLRCHSEPKFGPDEYFCETCPYDEATCGLDVPNDALSLLKAQEPRVMTLDEAAEADTCYIEYACGEVKPAFLRFSVQVAGYKSYKVMTDNNHHYFDGDKYGIILRCWTSRPTDEQREATPWKN